MKKRTAIFFMLANLFWFAPLPAAGLSIEIPVGETLANQLVQAYFPQALRTDTLDVLVHNPKVFVLEDNRVGLSATLRCEVDNYVEVAEGAVLVSAAVDFDAASREMIFIDPAIDSMVFFNDDPASRAAREAIVARWQQHVANPVFIAAGELGESELLTRYLRDIVVRESVVYFVYGGEVF